MLNIFGYTRAHMYVCEYVSGASEEYIYVKIRVCS